MTFEKLWQIIEENNIPHNVQLQSDSGWECCETEMDGVYYDVGENRLIFSQEGKASDEWFGKNRVYILNGLNKKCQECKHLCGSKCKVKKIPGHLIYDGDICNTDTSDCKDFDK